MTMTDTTPARRHVDLVAQVEEHRRLGRRIPESLRMELELADREACRSIRLGPRSALEAFASAMQAGSTVADARAAVRRHMGSVAS